MGDISGSGRGPVGAGRFDGLSEALVDVVTVTIALLSVVVAAVRWRRR